MKNLEDLLNNTDFSQESKNKEAIKAMLLNTIKNEEQKKYSKDEISTKKFRFRPMYLAAAAVVAVGVSIAACSEDIARIVQQFTVGRYATFVAPDDGVAARSTGQGDLSTSTAQGDLSMYFTDEEIANARSTGQYLIYETDDGVIAVSFRDDVFSYEKEIEGEKSFITYFDTINDAKPYLAFNPLMPVSLPNGFTLDRISIFNDENGRPLPYGKNMYLNVYYTNADKSQQIYMQIRKMNEETGFTASGSPDMRYISINGHEGVVAVKSVHVEIDGVMYMIFADFTADSITQQDVIKMAASLR